MQRSDRTPRVLVEPAKNTPKNYIDALTGQLMTDPVLVTINNELKVVDKTSVPKGFKGEIKPLSKLTIEIAKWRNISNGQVEVKPEKIARTLKLTLLGSPGAGKRTLVERFIESNFDDIANIDRTNFTIKRDLDNGDRIAINIMNSYDIWDRNDIHQGSDVIIYVVDPTTKRTYDDLSGYLTANDNLDHEKILAVTKSDLPDLRVVTDNDIRAYAKEKHLQVYNVSGKNGANVNDLLKDTIQLALKKAVEKDEKNAVKTALVARYNDLLIKLTSFITSQNIDNDKHDEKSNKFLLLERELQQNFFPMENSSLNRKSIQEIHQQIQLLENFGSTVKTNAKTHRENYKDHAVLWFFKFNFLRNPASGGDYKKTVEAAAKPPVVKGPGQQ